MRFTIPAATALLAAVLLPAAAHADPPLAVLKQLGLLGSWANVSCTAPVSKENSRVVYYDTGKGYARRRLERGSAPSLDGAVDSARVIAPGLILLTLRNDDPNWQQLNGMVYETEIEIANGRARTRRSVGSDGTVYIRDGTFRDGSPVPSLIHCDR